MGAKYLVLGVGSDRKKLFCLQPKGFVENIDTIEIQAGRYEGSP